MFGYRVVGGEGLCITISPTERHSALVLRVSRVRRNDTALLAEDDITAFRRAFATSSSPSLFMRASTTTDTFPDLAVRRGIAARDPLSTIYAFQVQIRVVLAALLGVRMCSRCPQCYYSSTPCQNMFGHTTLPMVAFSVRWMVSVALWSISEQVRHTFTASLP